MTHQLVITLGLPCSGKTSLIEKEYPLHLSISADDLKEEHPEYDPNDTAPIHQWSVKEAKKLLFEALDLYKDNIVFDSGSINNKYTADIMEKVMRDYGDYKIKLVWVKTPFKVCLDRNSKRFRKVPDYAITDKAVKEVSQYYKLLKYTHDNEIVDYFTNRYIFCDMDGVLAAQTTLPIINGEIDFVNGEIHKWQKPVNQVISMLYEFEKNGSEIYILSATPNSFSSDEKKDWLKKFFPVAPQKIFFVNQGKHKAEMLENVVRKLKLNKSDILMIDDTHSILYDVKARGMNAMHVSEFLTQ